MEEEIDQCANRSEDMWPLIKLFLSSKQHLSSCLQLQTKSGTITSFESMAKCFNDFFCSMKHEIGKHFDSSFPTTLNHQVH